MTGIYVGNSCFMIVILTILLLRIGFYMERGACKHYAMVFISAVEIYVLMDALFVKCFLDETVNVAVFRGIVFLFYLVYVTMPYVWHLFMQSYMDIRCGIKIRLLEMIPVVVLLLVVVTSTFSGGLWQIDESGIYTRGPLFGGFCVLNLFYYCLAFAQTCYMLVNRKRREKRYIFKSSLFSALPLIGILVNTYVIPLYGVYPFQPYCLVTGVLLAYLYMVEHQKKQLEIEQREQLVLALEHEKEATRKAKEAGAVKDTFLANMSHDIRTPMNAILGFSNMIAKHPDDEAVVRNAVTKIQASGDVLMKLINDILDLSKIESGKLTVEETATDLNQMSEKLNMMMEYSMKKKHIRFQIVNGLQHACVWCDATKLQQILVNILNNAVKFTPEGGKITLEYEETSVDETRSEYRISVQDTGIGMDEEFQKHAFEAFERERTSTESKTEGTGLGLAIVKKLIELMGGQVSIQSKVGEGTKITVCLRLKIAGQDDIAIVEKQKEPVIAANTKLSGVHVLLVEDNELNAEIAKEILTSAGMNVDWVEDGCACLERLSQVDVGYYQIILMDIQMPKMNGYEATKRIRELPVAGMAHIPIIAMTANAFSDDQKRALDVGMNGFITKPIDVDRMLKTIQQIIVER